MNVSLVIAILIVTGCATYEKCGPKDKSDYCEDLRRGKSHDAAPSAPNPSPNQYYEPADKTGRPVEMNPHFNPVGP